jgi:signal transduction histidine kinase
MLMPASDEFVALCQAQVTLLTQTLGAALSIVYLTEELTEVADAKLVPVVAYPDTIATWGKDQILALLSRGQQRPQSRLLPAETPANSAALTVRAASQRPQGSSYPNGSPQSLPLQAAEKALLRQQQIILPLIHEEMVMGLLVTARSDRAWSDTEQTQIKQIAETLAVACVLDQRSQWMAQDLHQQQMLWEQRQDLFDDLLHQFRNPLTALRTFGKLLMRRLQPEDTNRPVADSIVRESDRLEDLLKQLDIAADFDNLKPLPAQSPVPLLPESRTASQRPQGLPESITGASQLSPHAITEVLEPLLESAAAIAQDRQLTLQSKISPALPPVQTDLKMLREVLSNLLDNALKYTPAGGGIWVQVSEQGTRQAIVIADTGAGIPPQDLPRLFERHYRGVQAQTAISGSGLGLAIARELLHAMQSDIQIFSPAPNCGLLPPDYPATGTAAVVWLPTAG